MTRIILSDEKDQPILRFLWDWKVATTAMISKFSYGSSTAEGAYRRLMRLQKSDFVICRSDVHGSKFVWSVTQKGFRAIRARLPGLREEGFKSENIGHDLLVTGVHLGHWIDSRPEGVEFFTEQQLRRYQVADYPDWIPDTDSHRADGYWKIPVGEKSKTIALEVEVSRKTDSNYFSIGEFYRNHRDIFQVVWVLNGERKTLMKKLGGNLGCDEGFHNFINVHDFLRLGWNARVYSGNATGQSLFHLLVHSPSISHPLMEDEWKLDTSKSPHVLGGCQEFVIGDFCY